MSRLYPENQGLYDRANEHDNCGIGFVANIKGKKSHDIVIRGLEVLERMEHRGAEGADNKTGDGSGILMQIPHDYFKKHIKELPDAGTYGTGIMFLPTDSGRAEACIKNIESILKDEKLKVVAYRDIPRDNSVIGDIAKKAEPMMKQIVVTGDGDQKALELKLYIARKVLERTLTTEGFSEFYMPSFSTKTFVYKGMLAPDQVKGYYLDLQDEDLTSAVAMVHSRFSTNTFPAWELAQPFRILSHNGEINTVKGNRFWIEAKESDFKSDLFGKDIDKILPVIEKGKSDSASFDNALEMLVATGRSLPHALMMMVPESWNDKNPIPEDLKYFYEYHSTIMEPWDGPASIVFFDGRYVGGTLDRNGLRPSRYIITKKDMIVMGSEVGVQTFAPEEIAYKGRLRPGKLLLVDTEEGRIIPDEEIKDQISHQSPYKEWVDKNRVLLSEIKLKEKEQIEMPEDKLKELQHCFGYTREDLEEILIPMVNNSIEPTGSMGIDTALAIFNDRPQRLFNYFKQTFAQVTNPPIDPIREELVMSLTSYIGRRRNLLDETDMHCHMIKFLRPLFSNSDVQKIKESTEFKSETIDITFGNDESLEAAMDRVCKEADKAIDEGAEYLFLSDRAVNKDRVPIPSLLASSGVHHHLIRNKKRTKAGLVIETAEAREVMHFALLFAYGAGAVNPYGVFATMAQMQKEKRFNDNDDYKKIEDGFIKAIDKGILKVLSKMGTSTLRSYRGSQLTEAVGLDEEVIAKYFTGTPSRIGGIGLEELAHEAKASHEKAYKNTPDLLESAGVYSYRNKGEKHSWNPESIYMLQWATRTKSYKKYKEYTKIVDDETRRPHFIRGCFDFKKVSPIPLEEVEPVEEIMKRLTTGAMSFGSLSKEVHEAMAIAMNAIGGRSNSGEGGENPARFIKDDDGQWRRSAIKQVASGRFGVTSNYLANADEIQIKIAQGAKPGEGGQLPGHKVDAVIAKTRYSTKGVTLISPPPHHDIYSIEDLAQLIYDLKNANPNARISVKLVSETGVGTIAAGVSKAHADNILISGFDGGTGASPQSSINHAGLPFEIGIAETHQTLVLNNLRGRVRLQTDGQLKTGRDVVIAAMLGAEEFGFGTSALIVLGCIMMRKCHLNTCPAGVATQNEKLRKNFRGRPEHLINYFTFMAEEIREYMASLGIKTINELVGRTDLLVPRDLDHWKAMKVDPQRLLHMPEEAKEHATYCKEDQIHKIYDIIDRKLIEKVKPSLEAKKDFHAYIEMPIGNTDRSTGAMLSYEVSSRFGDEGLRDGSIDCTFRGSAGQSFGAFLASGINFKLEGDANDYLGKGLSGGRIIVVPPPESTFKAEENIIIGNTVLYGATSGEVYVRGIAGERFCVRNSGVTAVVEGTGDHCAEYMTGGKLIVLGEVGRNFAAGMSGGMAYVLDMNDDFEYYCNQGMVEITPVRDYDDQDFMIETIKKHVKHTDSAIGKEILKNWYDYLPKFKKIMPLEYKRALNEMKISLIDEKLKKIREEEQLEDVS